MRTSPASRKSKAWPLESKAQVTVALVAEPLMTGCEPKDSIASSWASVTPGVVSRVVSLTVRETVTPVAVTETVSVRSTSVTSKVAALVKEIVEEPSVAVVSRAVVKVTSGWSLVPVMVTVTVSVAEPPLLSKTWMS